VQKTAKAFFPLVQNDQYSPGQFTEAAYFLDWIVKTMREYGGGEKAKMKTKMANRKTGHRGQEEGDIPPLSGARLRLANRMAEVKRQMAKDAELSAEMGNRLRHGPEDIKSRASSSRSAKGNAEADARLWKDRMTREKKDGHFEPNLLFDNLS